MIWDTWNLQKRSNYLWWALFFLGYLSFGLIYIFLSLPYPTSSIGAEWISWIGEVITFAFFITLPLFIYKYPARATWLSAAGLLLLYIYSIDSAEEGGYFFLFLLESYFFVIAFILLGVLFPLFLQKKFTIKGLGLDIAVILLGVEVFTVVSSIVLLATIFL